MSSEYTGLLVLVGLAMTAVVGLLAYATIRFIMAARDKRRRFLEATARRLHGTPVTGGILNNPRIEFAISGRPAVVEFFPDGSEDPGRTILQVRLQGPSPGTLHILPEGFVHEFLKLFGAQDITIGDRDFDRDFVVKANPESLAAQIFSPERRERAVAAVRRLSMGNYPTIELTRNRLRIQINQELMSEGPVVTMVRTATDFLEFITAASVPVRADIELGEVKISKDSDCPVCGTTLGGLAVRCDSCRTPHHAECWKYVGQCSTYACSGKRWSA